MEIDTLNKAGIVGLLILIIGGGLKRVWVPGWMYNEKLREIERLTVERDRWMNRTFRALSTAEEIVQITKGETNEAATL